MGRLIKSVLAACSRKRGYGDQRDRNGVGVAGIPSNHPLATPDWFPLSLSDEGRLTFIQMTRDTFQQSSFHHESITRAGDRTLKAAIDKLAGLKPSVPSHLILHTSFCGSTLLARYLEDLAACFVLREPLLLTQLSSMPYCDSWFGWFKTSLSLLGRAYPSDAATIIKLHDFCNWMGNPILDLDPRVRIVFLYNPIHIQLLQFLKNQRRRKALHEYVVPGYPMALVTRLTQAMAGKLSDAQCAAATWLVNAHLCERLLARPDADRVLVMDGQCVISDPKNAVLAVAEHFGLANDSSRAALAELRPAMTHAKSRSRAYDAAALEADLASAERRYGEEVEAGIAWARELCPELLDVFDCARRQQIPRRSRQPDPVAAKNALIDAAVRRDAPVLSSHSRNESTFASALIRHIRRSLHHARRPTSVPALFWKNLKYALASRRPEFWNERGRKLDARDRPEEALACYDRALAIRDNLPQVWANRGRTLRELGRAEEAETSLREAVRLDPEFANAHVALGRVLDCLGRFEEAEANVRTALALDPRHALAHGLLGGILVHLGRAAEAQASLRMALRLRAEPRWHMSLGQALLLAGKLKEGWSEYEWRRHRERKFWWPPLLTVPIWEGEPIAGRNILIFADQGHGDTLQFCRYVPQIAASAGTTAFAVQQPLVRLMSRLPGVSEIITGGARPSLPDLWCPMMSLPHACGTTLETIPATLPYLTADPAAVAHWHDRLAGLGGLRVGLCWAGGQSSVNQIYVDRRRSIRLDALAPLGEIPGVRFFSLQKGPASVEADRPPRGMMLHDFTNDLHDFADTAALIENLDLIISVDTAVVHLAGALGKSVWLLNRFDTCWRWLQTREDSPWYPTLRQFRQPTPGDWHSVIGRARDALQKLAAGDPSGLRSTSTAA